MHGYNRGSGGGGALTVDFMVYLQHIQRKHMHAVRHVSLLGLAPFVGEEVAVHNNSISLLLSISVWVI